MHVYKILFQLMQAIAQRNARNRKKLQIPHTLGQTSLAIKKDQLVWFTQSAG